MKGHGYTPGMKAAAAAVAVSLAAFAMALLALQRETRRGEELERRIAALEADVAARAKAPASPVEPPRDPVAGPVPAATPAESPGSDKKLAKLEKDIDRLEEQMRRLSRNTHGPIEDEIAGLDAEKLWDKAQMALKDRQSERGDALLRAFLEKFPRDPKVPQALLALAGNELSLGDTAEAQGLYEQIVRDFAASEQAPYAEFYLGICLADSDIDSAKSHYEKAVQGLSSNPYYQAAAFYNLGDAYREKGDVETAKEYYRKVTTQFTGATEKKLVDAAQEQLKALESK